jgi:hypothetical protein
VLYVNAFGHNKIIVYLWQYKEKKRRVADENEQSGFKWVGTGEFSWRVQQKMGVNFEQNWNDMKVAIDKYMQMMKVQV